MRRFWQWTSVVGLLVLGQAAWTAPPRRIAEIASVDELEAEIRARLAEIEPFLADEATFAEQQKRLEQAASMLAVAAQALADHDDASPLKPFAADLREGAVRLARAESLPEAAEGWKAAQAARDGTSDKSASVDVDWARLVRQRPIMEEMEARMLQLQRQLRRPRDLPKESRHAAAVALAGLTTLVDTHEVKDTSKLPEWERLSRQIVEQMKNVASAMKDNKPAEAQAEFKKARGTCVECHRAFNVDN
jgi:hypothetical protein